MDAALLLLGDGRFPAGGHAYSAGVESAVSVGDVIDTASLERYLAGRLATTGRVDAAFAAYTCGRITELATIETELATIETELATIETELATIDTEYSARVLSPYLRATSRRFGRQLLRVAAPIWPSPSIAVLSATDGGPHQAIAMGAVVAAAGGAPDDAAALVFHHLASAVTTAGVRLLGLDPLELAGMQARMGRRVDAARPMWVSWCAGTAADLPADGGTLTEILGERHGALDARLFVA